MKLLPVFLVPFILYSIYFNVNLYRSNLLIEKSLKLLEAFEFDMSLKQAALATKISPNNAEAFLNQAHIYGILWLLRKESLYENLMNQSFKKAFNLNKFNAVYRYKRAAMYSDAGDYKSAIKYIEDAIQIDPFAGAYWNEKATYLEMDNRPAEALISYKEAYSLSKKSQILSEINRLEGNNP